MEWRSYAERYVSFATEFYFSNFPHILGFTHWVCIGKLKAWIFCGKDITKPCRNIVLPSTLLVGKELATTTFWQIDIFLTLIVCHCQPNSANAMSRESIQSSSIWVRRFNFVQKMYFSISNAKLRVVNMKESSEDLLPIHKLEC